MTEQTRKILGLDVGLRSVGWAVVEVTEDSGEIKGGDVLDAGVRTFKTAEVDYGKSPAEPRRMARSQRRRLYRRQQRMQEIRRLFEGKIPELPCRPCRPKTGSPGYEERIAEYEGELAKYEQKIAEFHHQQNQMRTPWDLRVKGLDEKLNSREWIAVLIHLAKRRGYKSNRKEEAEVKSGEGEQATVNERRKVLSALEKNKKNLADGKYRTIGEMLVRGGGPGGRRRNRKDYTNIVSRQQLEDEIKLLFAKQRELGNEQASDDLCESYLNIWGRQRSFDYRLNVATMIGNCTFEPDEKRAPMDAYSSEYARLLQTINRIEIRQLNGEKRWLWKEVENAREKIVELARQKENISYRDLRKALKLSCRWRFVGIFYRTEEKRLEAKVNTLKFKLTEEAIKRISSSGVGKGEFTHRDIKDAIGLPDHFQTDKRSGDSAVKKEALKSVLFKLTEKKVESIYREIHDKLVTQSNKVSYADVGAQLSLSDILVFDKMKKDTDYSEKEFFKFSQISCLRRAVEEKLGDDVWQQIVKEQEKKDLLLDATRFGVNPNDKREFLMEKNIPKNWIKAVEGLSISDSDGDEHKEKFKGMPGWHNIKAACKSSDAIAVWEKLQGTDNEEIVKTLDGMARIAATYKDDEKIQKEVATSLPSIVKDDIELLKEVVLRLSMRKFGALSLKALRKITPHLEEGCMYSEACKNAGYNHSHPQEQGDRIDRLPALIDGELIVDPDKIRNPRVIRALAQARKVVNAIIQKHGLVHAIHIELLRDLARNWQERDDIKKGQNEFRDQKDAARRVFHEIYGIDKFPKAQDILKFRLWKEQGGYSPYSDTYLDPHRLLEDGYVDIDHILPMSRSLDDSQTNKVLCLATENREKRDRIPYEWFCQDKADWEKHWDEFSSRVRHYRLGRREKLLRRKFSEEDAKEHRKKWVEGAESKWIARELKSVLERLEFAPSDNEVNVQTRNGAFTGFLRAQWGLHKNREDDLHHAVDAMILAFSNQSMVHKVMQWSKGGEVWVAQPDVKGIETVDEETGEVAETKYLDKREEFNRRFNPGVDLRKKILERKGRVFVSRPPVCKLSGEAHKAKIEKIPDTKKRKELEEQGMLVRGGKPKGGWTVLRADVFEKAGKFYISIVRPYHHVWGKLPDQLIKGQPLNEGYSFKFSLYPGDAVLLHAKITGRVFRNYFSPSNTYAGVTWRNDEKEIYVIGYYRTVDATNGQITIEAHDRSWGSDGKFHPGIQGLLGLEKLSIPILGDIEMEDVIDRGKYIVKEKERDELAKPRNHKPCRS